MGSEQVQITIPDLNEDEYSSTPISFGRSTPNPFGLGGGQDSPTSLTTPLAFPDRTDRSYFHHARGDSFTSDDSSNSATRRPTPFAHSSQSSLATSTSTSPFSKKPSFASIRNPFKSSSNKHNDPPPVPPIDHQAYPILKNPFNRSASSLALGPRKHPAQTTPPSQPRPPVSIDLRTSRASKSRNHSYSNARSQHSHSGSLFHASDAGSDYGQVFPFGLAPSSSPPPVPRMPNGFTPIQTSGLALGRRSESPAALDIEDKIVMDPRTPSDYALHAVFIRFATAAELKTDAFLRVPHDQDPLLPDFMGPGVDPTFDALLLSLGQIAQKHTRPVIDSILRWRRSQNESVGPDYFRTPPLPSLSSTSLPQAGALASERTRALLNERKSLVSVYLMCRALIAVLQQIVSRTSSTSAPQTSQFTGSSQFNGSSSNSLQFIGEVLEETTFDQFRKPDLKLLAQSSNHRSNAELYATLLGLIAGVRFTSVTDRFLAELSPVTSGQVTKDLDLKYENLVRGLKHVPIKVWPPEAFEEGAEFMESLSKSFMNSHGLGLKIAFAETLTQLLHPVGKTAQAEVNHPQWAKAIEIIYPRVRDMTTKPRYWAVAYPLLITSICVAPHQFFLRNWTWCFENGLSKLKEKQHRTIVMNGMIRLMWTYLYRCQEPMSTTVSKLDNCLKKLFPTNRNNSAYPHEEPLEPFIYITHFILSRHFEYGRDFCLELMQEPAIISAAQSSPPTGSNNVLNLISSAPERIAIAVQAILLSMHLIERDEPAPMWPSLVDFNFPPSWADYPSSADPLPSALLMKKLGLQELFDRCAVALARVALASAKEAGHMSLLDDKHAAARWITEEAPSLQSLYIVRKHPEGTVAYPSHLSGIISVLQTCFQAWPRCLPGAYSHNFWSGGNAVLAPSEAVDILLRGVVHIEPSVADVAVAALRRFPSAVVLARFAPFLFSPVSISNEGTGVRMAVESSRLLQLWVNIVEKWVQEAAISQRQSEEESGTAGVLPGMEDKNAVLVRCDEIEAGALFLLSSESWPLHATGVKVIRMLGVLVAQLGFPGSPAVSSENRTSFPRVVDLLQGRAVDLSVLEGFDDFLDKGELERLEQWRKSGRVDVLLRIADSPNEIDRKLWRLIFPSLMQRRMEGPCSVLSIFRETLVAAASKYHPIMAHLAGLSTRVPAGFPRTATHLNSERDGNKLVKENKTFIDQWFIWAKILSSTASLSESRPALTHIGREHSRVPSETVTFERERMTTTRGLFRYLTPFLDSEYTTFRDAAVISISSLPSSGYPQLLEDLNLLAARQFYDESRTMIKPGSTPNATATAIGRTRRQERLHSAVARIYFLTAGFLQNQRSSGRQIALSHVLKFVRNTQAFLVSLEAKDNYTLQRLRRYFCGTVERVFDGLAALKDSDRFIPQHMHLSLFRLCEEWCQIGNQSEMVKQRTILMRRAATVAGAAGGVQETDSVEKFQHESKLLSDAAIGALSALCAKAFYPADVSSGSPTERSALEYLRPLEVGPTLDRICVILASSQSSTQSQGKKALRSLLSHRGGDANLLSETLRRAFITGTEQNTSTSRFFEVVADVICNVENHGFSFSQVVCLGLWNLCHPQYEIRRHAFNILETIHLQSSGILSMTDFEAIVGSSSTGTYVRAHRLVSDFLAGVHPQEATSVLSQLALWLPLMSDSSLKKTPLLLLQSLEGWISNVDLMNEDKSGLSEEGLPAIYNLVTLTLRYGATYAEQILVLWTKLVDAPHQSNGHATIRFLLEHSHKVGSIVFIDCAANIVACLCQTAIGKSVFKDLCSVIEPERMLPNFDHRLEFPSAVEKELWSDLDALFAEKPRLALGDAQFALLFLGDATLERQWEMQEQLPILLHSIFTQLDHRSSYVRQQARRMLFQLMRSWIPAYDDLADRAAHPNRSMSKALVSGLEEEAESRWWKEEDSAAQCEPAMQWLSSQVLKFFEPLTSNLAERWGYLALNWGTSCPFRATASRSLQIFRAIMPRTTKSGLGLLLARLSTSIAADDDAVKAFTSELILTMNVLISSDVLEPLLFPQTFWCACAALSTTLENEFTQVLELLCSLLRRVDLNDHRTVELFTANRPLDWKGTSALQPSLLSGLRSSVTSDTTLRVLQALARIDDARLIDPTEGRVRDLFTVSLPWCLHSMVTDTQDEALRNFTLDIARLAEEEDRHSITRIMTSFAKGRFRTKDDFLRQSVASLREHYGAEHWSKITTLLLGLVLNSKRWLRVQAMQILKVLFQQRESREPVDLLGSEHLMPLLRLLETDLASQALEVLEEPMTISGGPAAKHVLRMSMHMKSLTAPNTDPVTDIFGIAEESGWCVARVTDLRERCRTNILAVFDTCKISTRPSRLVFEPEVKQALSDPMEDLGGLVQNLHELSTFFQDERSRPAVPLPMPSQQLEARVAAILAKSTDAIADTPQTPFVDVFSHSVLISSDDSDNSDTESEPDAFIYDSPSFYRNGSNGSRVH